MFFVFNLEPIWEAGILPLNYSRLLALSAISVLTNSKQTALHRRRIYHNRNMRRCAWRIPAHAASVATPKPAIYGLWVANS
jgi:hypothetical protein